MTQDEILAKLRRDLEQRGRSEETIKEYTTKTRLFQEHYGKPADQLGEAEIIEWLHHRLTVVKNSPNSVNTDNSALRFLYGVTLDVVLNTRKLPRIKQARSLPQLFTREEAMRIINSASCLTHKAMLMLAYGSGLRLSEITGLKVSDIDSAQMRIFVRKGKGARDRYALLPQASLAVLREYWLEQKPRDWLFVAPKIGGRYYNRTLQDAFKSALKRSGVTKYGTIHTLRHCFATHLLEDGNNLLAIRRLLGHVRIDSTVWYTQIATSEVLKLKSPVDGPKPGRGRKPKRATHA